MMAGVYRHLEAWVTFLAWYLRVSLEPYVTATRNFLGRSYCCVKLYFTRLFKGSYYPFSLLDEAIRRVLKEKGIDRPTAIQVLGIPKVLRGENVLLMAPTGSGKTECAFLPIIHMLLQEGEKLPYGVRVLYITPLRALCSDIAQRIRSYVREIMKRALGGVGLFYDVRAWHSDIDKVEKDSMRSYPPLVLVTTPESLEKILDTEERMREHLKNLRYVVIDEVHELVDSKRGHHLLILLERLKASLHIKRLQRILLSATVADPKKIAALFGGSDGKVSVVRDPGIRRMEIDLLLRPGVDAADAAKSLVDLINDEGYLVFVNTRAEAEYLHAELERLGTTDIRVHHGSLSSEARREVERKFREGTVRGVVCTRTLELGIDIGRVKKVVQIGSPSLPEYLAQRLGRSSHKPGKAAQGTVVCLDNADLLEVVALIQMLKRGMLCGGKRLPPCLDIMAREIVAIALQDSESAYVDRGKDIVGNLHSLFTRAVPYRKVTRVQLRELLKELTRRQLVRMEGGRLKLGQGFKRVWGGSHYPSFFSLIPERQHLTVYHEGKELGHIDPVNLKYLRRGAVIRLGGSSWRVIKIAGWNVYVKPERGERFAVPIWRGGYFLTPQIVGIEVYRSLSKLAKLHKNDDSRITGWLSGGSIAVKFDKEASRSLITLIENIRIRGEPIPSPRVMVVDELFVRRGTLLEYLPVERIPQARHSITLLLYPFGEKIANTLASALWESGNVYRVVPKCYGMLIRHRPGFDPLAYLLGLDLSKLQKLVETSPYIFVSAYEERRSFGYISVERALQDSRLLKEDCIKQVAFRFYDVKGTSRLLTWIKYGCIRVIRREVREREKLHPLSSWLFGADKYFEPCRHFSQLA